MVRVYNVWYQVGRFWPWGPLGVGMDLEKAIDQCRLRSAVLGEEVGDLKFVAAAVSGCLPFIADEQAPRGRIEDQMPAIHIQRASGRAQCGRTHVEPSCSIARPVLPVSSI